MPEDFRNSSHYCRTIEDDRRDSAEARTRLWHYTDAEALYKIVSSRAIRFTRIDRVNDLEEKTPLLLEELYKGTYIACFSHNEIESIPLWSMYTSRGRGVRIEFEFMDKKIHSSFIGIKNINECSKEKCDSHHFSEFTSFIHDIEYTDEMKVLPVLQEDDDIFVNQQAIAFEKNTIWNYEEETRIMMFTGNYSGEDMPDYFDFLLDFKKIINLRVVFDPWMSEEIKQSVRLTTKYYLNEFSDIVSFYNSDLEGRIR